MESRNFHLHGGKHGSALAVRITPKASRNEITEITDDGTVKVRLTPAENKANEALLEFLADVLGVQRKQLEIVAGVTGRDKLVSVDDMDKDELNKRIVAHLS
jgi:uncharacterized protein (TIGR00251 family)